MSKHVRDVRTSRSFRNRSFEELVRRIVRADLATLGAYQRHPRAYHPAVVVSLGGTSETNARGVRACSHIHLRKYKRFAELTVELPEPFRLVMLCGPNGSGKSSLFEALKLWQDLIGNLTWSVDPEYHLKDGALEEMNWRARSEVEFHEGTLKQEDIAKSMYFRTAYRNEPEFAQGQIGRSGDLLAGPRPLRMIDNDIRVSDNYQRLVGRSVDVLFSGADDQLRVAEVRERFIGRLGQALTRVLPDLKLQGLADPLGGGTFRFAKGITEDFPYKNLSGGEKAVFDLLLDMAVKSEVFSGAIVLIDEPEAHTNPLVQARLLDALLDLAGQESQLWFATHSIGMLRRAREISDQTPGYRGVPRLQRARLRRGPAAIAGLFVSLLLETNARDLPRRCCRASSTRHPGAMRGPTKPGGPG